MAFSILLPFILTILSLLPNHLYAQNNPSSVINLNSNITAGSNSSWKSPSGEFEFGFYHLSGEEDLYLAGIWFGNISERTLVWYQNPPMQANSFIQLASPGNFVLRYPNGTTALEIYNGGTANSAMMQDNGNFVINDSDSRVVWQSFDNPTNTMLPGQILKSGQSLYAKGQGSLNYSNGNFRVLMQTDGNLVVIAYQWQDPSYWYSDTSSFKNVTLVFNQSATLYLASDTTNVKNLTQPPTPAQDYYHRATIDEYGKFEQFSYHKRNRTGWTKVWTTVVDPCRVNDICGVNGFCTSPDNQSVKCGCIPGYIPFDPNDVSLLGCRPQTVVDYCQQQSPFNLQVLDDTDFQFDSLSDFAEITTDLEGCKKYVMDDCHLAAATFNATTSTCATKRMPLFNARNSSSSKGQKALLKVPIYSNSTNGSNGSIAPKKKIFNVRVFLKAMVGISSTFACLFLALAVYYHPFTQRLMRRKKFLSASAIGINFREFTYQELHEATNGFSKIMGKGSSAKVYRGSLRIDDAEIIVAVKMLDNKIETESNEKEFMTELKIIGRTHHRNLVRLLGFCLEKNHRLLVYELMPNGALSNFLFGQREKPQWSQRIEMALGIARGLLYLHEECETQIIHCDIKPQNVLLDANYTAKIADFGLSKLLSKDQTRTNTNFRGTIGYMAPEWLRSAPITTKVDVYSFGVMLLEIICCKRHVEPLQGDEEEDEEDDKVLSKLVLRCMVSRKLEHVVDNDSEVLGDLKRFEEMALIGLWCIHPDPTLRPTMKQVNQMLEGTMAVGVPPLLYDEMTPDQSV